MAGIRFRKREPIEVEAMRVTNDPDEIALIVEWCGGRIMQYGDEDSNTIIKLLTKQRLQIAITGEYIYKDHEGYFHKVSAREFLFEYEEIQGDDPVIAQPKENNQ